MDKEQKRQITIPEQRLMIENEIKMVESKIDFLSKKLERESGRKKEILTERIKVLQDIIYKDEIMLMELEFEEEYEKINKSN